jgi:hypothetical protein
VKRQKQSTGQLVKRSTGLPNHQSTHSPIDRLVPDVEAQAIMARAARIAACEREVWEAVRPILERHRCRLGTVQEVVDGQAGAVKIVVFANDG